MRIGLLIYGDINTLSGGYLYDRKLIAYLQERGDEVVIISFPGAGFWRRLGDNFRPMLINRLLEADLDVLIVDELVHPSLCLRLRRLRQRLPYPVVALLHLLATFDAHPPLRARAHRFMERRFLAAVDGLIANSQTTLQQARDLMGSKTPPHVIALPAGDNFAQSESDPEDTKTPTGQTDPLQILFVGNVIRRKGLHVLLKALAELPAENFRLTVAGRLDMEPAYVKSIKRDLANHLAGNAVTLTGPVQGEALAGLYQQHDLLVMPSAFEGYGIVYVEAQQFGLPVIGTTAGAAKEIIRPGENGYLIAPGDHRELATLLKNLQQNRALLAELGDNARRAFAAHPTWANTGADIRRFLQTLTAQGN